MNFFLGRGARVVFLPWNFGDAPFFDFLVEAREEIFWETLMVSEWIKRSRAIQPRMMATKSKYKGRPSVLRSWARDGVRGNFGCFIGVIVPAKAGETNG
jgi:hypothetical protein